MILTDEQKTALRYIHAANQGGYRPSAAEVDEWRLRPDPKPGKKGKRIRDAVPGTPPMWAASLAATNQEIVRQFSRSFVDSDALRSLVSINFQGLLGRPGRPAEYEPDGPPEPFLDSLVRLSWLLADDEQRLSLSALGRTLMRSDEVQDDSAGDVLVLDKEDDFAYASLIGHIAEMGQVLVVDPYLRAQQLLDLIRMTSANRYLIGYNISAKEVASMQTLVSASGWAVAPELRQARAGQLHDRYLVGHSEMYTLGLSINGVGRRNATVLMPLPIGAADHIRSGVEDLWNNSEVLAPLANLESRDVATECKDEEDPPEAASFSSAD